MLDFITLVAYVAGFGIAVYVFFRVIGFVLESISNVIGYLFGDRADAGTQVGNKSGAIFTYVDKNDGINLFPFCISLSVMSMYWYNQYGTSLITGLPLFEYEDYFQTDMLNEMMSDPMDNPMNASNDIFDTDNSGFNNDSSFNDY